MDNKIKEIIDFANNNSSCWFATSNDDVPYMRGYWMWYADETGFYFHTGKSKRVYNQILKNDKVALGFMQNWGKSDFKTMHVNGIATEVHDEEMMKRLLSDRPWITGNINKSGVPTDVVIYRVHDCECYIWDMSYNVNENKIPRVRF